MPSPATVFVTGADGFIGSHLTEALVRRGMKVRALTLYNSFNSWGWLDHCAAEVQGQFEVISGDVRDPVPPSLSLTDFVPSLVVRCLRW
jgi:dTDP-glucose 4,6-dehydratase